MKKIRYLIFMIFISCNSNIAIKKNDNFLKCEIIEIKEYTCSFRFKALNNKKDTILIVSLKKDYFSKFQNKKYNSNQLEEIRLNNKYNFHLIQIKPSVSTMEQLGSFIVVENDTLFKAHVYKNIPPSYMGYNVVEKYYIKNH